MADDSTDKIAGSTSGDGHAPLEHDSAEHGRNGDYIPESSIQDTLLKFLAFAVLCGLLYLGSLWAFQMPNMPMTENHVGMAGEGHK